MTEKTTTPSSSLKAAAKEDDGQPHLSISKAATSNCEKAAHTTPPLSFQAAGEEGEEGDGDQQLHRSSSAATSTLERPSILNAPPAVSPHLPITSWSFWKQLLRFMGPGFMVAMAYIDPGNLAADINQGVVAGYNLAWVTLWCSVMGYVIQVLSAKLGVVTTRHLAQHCRAEYPAFPRILLWAIAELGIIAVDMIEVIGGATALRTLSNGSIPLWAGVLVTASCGFIILWLERWGMRWLEAVLITMIGMMAGAFGFMFFSSGVDYGQVALGLVIPRLNSETIPFAVGAVGAIIMPHNLFLHSDLVLERPNTNALRGKSVKEAMRYVRLEAFIALSLALIINIFIIAVFGKSFGPDAEVSFEDGTCSAVGLGDAGSCLGSVYGAYMQYIWGAGLLAAALASTVTSTYAGQVVITGMMNIKVATWYRTAAVRLVTLGPTLSIAFLVKSDSSLNALTEWLNIIQSLVLPFVVAPLLIFTSSTKIMGPHANRPWAIVALSLVLSFLVSMNGYLAVTFALGKLPPGAWSQVLFFGVGCVAYVTFGVYLLLGPRRVDRWAVNGAKRATAKVRQTVMSRAVGMMDVHV